jgi:hypothetical protein
MEKDAPTNGLRAYRNVTKAPRDGHNENGKAAVPAALREGHNGNGKAAVPSHFASKLVSSVPHSRKGKHNLIVSMILDDLDELEAERAILVPLENLDGEKMENVRSALNRATRQRNMVVATATDEKYFYVWRSEVKTEPAPASLKAGSRNSQR